MKSTLNPFCPFGIAWRKTVNLQKSMDALSAASVISAGIFGLPQPYKSLRAVKTNGQLCQLVCPAFGADGKNSALRGDVLELNSLAGTAEVNGVLSKCVTNSKGVCWDIPRAHRLNGGGKSFGCSGRGVGVWGARAVMRSPDPSRLALRISRAQRRR